MKLVLTIGAVCLAISGCSATCLRNSDCIGAALCKEDRCILVVKGDAGSRGPLPTPTPESTPDPESDAESETPIVPDAGTGPTGSLPGSRTTPDRTIVDAASLGTLPRSAA